MIFALMLGAFFPRIWFSLAAGIRMSQSSSRRSVLETAVVPARPVRVTGEPGTSFVVHAVSAVFRRIQSGYVYHYAFVMIVGVFGLLYWWGVR